MSEWQLTTLAEMCETITVGHVGSMASEYVERGIPFLRSQNVRPGRLEMGGLKYISEEFHQRLRKSQLRVGDVVIVRTGQPGAAALIPDDVGELNCSDLVIARPASWVDSRFLCYAINATSGHYVAAHLVGAVQQHFNVGSARNLKIYAPPLPQQRAIADVLATLDDKIVANERVAATADKLAQAKYLELASGASTVAPLGDILDLKYGKALTSSSRRPGNVVVFGSGGPTGAHDEALVSGPGIVVGRKGTVGAVYWSQEDFFPIDTTFYVEMRQQSVPIEFAFFALRDLGLRTMNSDSAVPGLNRSNVLALSVALPPKGKLVEFVDEIRSLFALRHSVSSQSTVLAELRDTLLPKLMSGETCVRDAEKAVEGVT